MTEQQLKQAQAIKSEMKSIEIGRGMLTLENLFSDPMLMRDMVPQELVDDFLRKCDDAMVRRLNWLQEEFDNL